MLTRIVFLFILCINHSQYELCILASQNRLRRKGFWSTVCISIRIRVFLVRVRVEGQQCTSETDRLAMDGIGPRVIPAYGYSILILYGQKCHISGWMTDMKIGTAATLGFWLMIDYIICMIKWLSFSIMPSLTVQIFIAIAAQSY
ncbi:hypothetical protein ACJX0J_009663, partial [Zea mays]